jgi:hypothetical protein
MGNHCKPLLQSSRQAKQIEHGGDVHFEASFEDYVLEICQITQERGGVTSKVDTHQFVEAIDAWGVPKYPDRTVILPPGADLLQEVTVFIERNSEYLYAPDCWLGTWIDSKTGNCYLDVTAIYASLEDAWHEVLMLSQCAQRKIVALYNFKQERTVYLSRGILKESGT